MKSPYNAREDKNTKKAFKSVKPSVTPVTVKPKKKVIKKRS